MNRKAKIIIAVLSVLLVISWIGAGAEANQLTASKADSNHWFNCSQEAIKAQAIATGAWNTLVQYQNSGYQVDSYTAGQLTSDINKMNTSINDYNANCAGNNPIPTVSA